MRFDITPLDGMVDGDLVVRVTEGTPRARVNITAEAEDADGRMWSASAQFLVSEDGTIDLSKEPPIQGSYSTLDPMGIVTTMAPAGKEPASIFATPDASDVRITFTASERDSATATALAIRRFKAATVQPRRIDEGAIAGTLYLPEGTDTRPAVLVVPGTIHPRSAAAPMAALLASRGYITFLLDYLGRPGMPETFTDVPLEHLALAVDWLRDQPTVDDAAVAALGLEKGAEFLLAAASYIPDLDLRAVLTIAPSCVTWQGTVVGKGPATSSWTIGGAEVPYVAVKGGSGQKLLRSLTKKEGGAVSQLLAHTEAFTAEALKRAALPVEKIAGPLLLLAGFDDQQWPSGEMAEMIYRARRAEHCNEGDQKITFQKVGRLIRYPHLPMAASNRYLDPSGGGGWMLGGSADTNQHADEVGWAKIIDFLGVTIGVPAMASVTGRVAPPVEEPRGWAETAAQALGVGDQAAPVPQPVLEAPPEPAMAASAAAPATEVSPFGPSSGRPIGSPIGVSLGSAADTSAPSEPEPAPEPAPPAPVADVVPPPAAPPQDDQPGSFL